MSISPVVVSYKVVKFCTPPFVAHLPDTAKKKTNTLFMASSGTSRRARSDVCVDRTRTVLTRLHC